MNWCVLWIIGQWFSNLSTSTPSLHILYLPYQTHLIQLISSLVETARPELGVSDEGDIQNVYDRFWCRLLVDAGNAPFRFQLFLLFVIMLKGFLMPLDIPVMKCLDIMLNAVTGRSTIRHVLGKQELACDRVCLMSDWLSCRVRPWLLWVCR